MCGVLAVPCVQGPFLRSNKHIYDIELVVLLQEDRAGPKSPTATSDTMGWFRYAATENITVRTSGLIQTSEALGVGGTHLFVATPCA